EAARKALRTGEAIVSEESVVHGGSRQVFLTSHRPARIAGRDLLLSSSADITEQKAFEDQLFRSAYYDELTDLPNRRGIQAPVNKLLPPPHTSGVAAALLHVDNFKHTHPNYGPPN